MYSLNSLSILPPQPQIFHGRRPEVEEIVQRLTEQSPRIAIVGPGGIGKTSLSRAVLHHPDVTASYGLRFFVPCDSATKSNELAGIIGSYIGLKPGRDLRKPVVQYLSQNPPCLLILDNLETSWEPLDSRAQVEEFLSLLSDIPYLALMVCTIIHMHFG